MSMNRNHKLTTADLGKFSPFRVGPELLERADIRRVTDAEAREEYGITGHGDRAGLVFPYYNPVSGQRWTVRLRRDRPDVGPDGKEDNKYISAYGDRRHLYFVPGAGPSSRTVMPRCSWRGRKVPWP